MSGLTQRVINSNCPFSQAFGVARGRSHTGTRHRSACALRVRCQAKGTNARRRPQLAFQQPPKGTPAVQRPAADANLVERLQNISLVMVGDDTDLNGCVAQTIAKPLGYVPLVTAQIIEQLTQQSPAEIVAAEGLAALGGAEAVVLGSLSTQLRSCIATCGGGGGGAARGDCWRHLFGFISIWLDTSWQREPDAPQREAYQQAEVCIAVAQNDTDSLTSQQIADGILPQILQAIDQLVRQDANLCGKKGVYMKFGCRGDWPDLQPPDENAAMSGVV